MVRIDESRIRITNFSLTPGRRRHQAFPTSAVHAA
jgi:hypothetical protein